MAFWSGEKLLQRVQAEKLVEPFDPSAIDCAAYTLSIGEYAFTSADDKDRAASAKPGEVPGMRKLAQNEMFSIRPGQFAFLLTEQVVTIPNNAIGFISVKAGRKLEGLINVSGFHVDPGWSSRLIFGVFNAGPQELVFKRGQSAFLLFLADLSPADATNESGKKEARSFTYPVKNRYDHIPPEMVQKMSGPVPSLYRVDKAAKDLENRVGEVSSRASGATNTARLALAISLAVLALVARTVWQSASGVNSATNASPPAVVQPPSNAPPQPAAAPSTTAPQATAVPPKPPNLNSLGPNPPNQGKRP